MFVQFIDMIRSIGQISLESEASQPWIIRNIIHRPSFFSDINRSNSNATSCLLSSIRNISKSNSCQFIKYSPPFWITHCSRSIHARIGLCNSSKVISSHSSVAASKMSFGLCRSLSFIQCLTLRRGRSHAGSSLMNRQGVGPGYCLLCPRLLPLSCHWGRLNCPYTRQIRSGFSGEQIEIFQTATPKSHSEQNNHAYISSHLTEHPIPNTYGTERIPST
jgi:hypothetical protein